MTPEQRRELIERPFPPIRTLPRLPHSGTGVTRWDNGMGAVQGQSREWKHTTKAFMLGGVLYGEDYYRW